VETDRIRALLARLDRMSVPEIEALLSGMRDHGLDLAHRDEFLLALTAWAERDPIAAAGFVMSIGGDDEMKSSAIAAWTRSDPDAALRWVRETHPGEAAYPWLVGAAKGLAPEDPEAARALIEELPRGRFRNRALDTTLGHVLQHGGDFAAEWINATQDERLQQSSAAWIAARMAERDSTAAAAWIESLNGSVRLEAAEQVADQMAASDPAAAFHWLAGIGSGEEIDPALRDIVKSGFKQDPASALTASLHLADERSKAKITERYISRWQESDPAAAAAWLQSHGQYLPSFVRERFTTDPNAVSTIIHR
jgi:hypothetical protein